jgi:hypothetical protein
MPCLVGCGWVHYRCHPDPSFKGVSSGPLLLLLLLSLLLSVTELQLLVMVHRRGGAQRQPVRPTPMQCKKRRCSLCQQAKHIQTGTSATS